MGSRLRSQHGAPRDRSVRGAEREQIVVAANAYIVGHYPIGFLGGTPRRLVLGDRELWIVPILLTSPGRGAVAETGLVAVDAGTHAVVGSTPRRDVVAAGKRLREARRDELEAAFRRATRWPSQESV